MHRRSAPPRHRARATRALLALGLALGGTVVVGPANAESVPSAPLAPTAPLAPPSPDLPGLPATSIELARVPVTSPEFERAATRYGEVDARHSGARDRRHDLDHTTSVLQGRVLELDAVRASARGRVAGLSARLDVLEAAITELAVEAFVAGGEDERAYGALVSDTPSISEVDRRDVLGGLTMDVLLAERAAHRARIAEAQARADEAVEALRGPLAPHGPR